MRALILTATLLGAGATQAASFDCTKVAMRMERAICDNPQLSGLDEELDLAYRNAKNRLSPEGWKKFARGQVSWLRFHSTHCFVDRQARAVAGTEAARCLIEAYRQRIRDIEDSGREFAGLKTLVVVDNQINVSPRTPSVASVERRYVQIDGESRLASRLNEYLLPGLSPPGGGSEVSRTTLAVPTEDWFYRQEDNTSVSGSYSRSHRFCSVYSKSQDRLLFVRDFFSHEDWKKIAERQVRQHFLTLSWRDPRFAPELLEQLSLAPLDKGPNQVFLDCFDADGIRLSGFLPQTAAAFDGVTVSWEALSEVLTPYARQHLDKLIRH